MKQLIILLLALELGASPLTDCIDKLSQDNDRDKDITIISACVEYAYPRTSNHKLDKECYTQTYATWGSPMMKYYQGSTIPNLGQIIRKAVWLQCAVDCTDSIFKEDKVCR
jgi:hypothetical protein